MTKEDLDLYHRCCGKKKTPRFVPHMFVHNSFGKNAPLAMMIPTITPKSPSADPKISMINIFTNISGFCASLEDMIHYTTKFRFQANQIVNQISNSPKKQEQKRDMKRIKQDGISILEVCLPPP